MTSASPQRSGPAARLRAASDDELKAILSAADAADIAMHRPLGTTVRSSKRPTPGTSEILLLGTLGCRYGMLAGGAGGHLVRTPSTTVLVDPGPAALGTLVRLARRELFDWSELDAVCVTHFHPDHYTDLIPCLEGMAAHTVGADHKPLVANPTVIERFTEFSPYHVGGMAESITLAHPETDGDGEPSIKVGDLTIHATPAAHTEERGRSHSAIGLAYQTPAANIWYTSDTNLYTDLLCHIADILPGTDLIIAHADASNIDQVPGRAESCHLETRDVPTIATALRPDNVLIQHYDAAYSTAEYRIAQALWLQRNLDRSGLSVRVLPSADGLRLTLSDGCIVDHGIELDSAEVPAVVDYLRTL